MSRVVRAFAVWLLLLVAAIVNGGGRQALLIPAMGEPRAHIVSTLWLCVLIVGIAWLASSWLKITSSSEAWRVGATWLSLTVGFEFLAGHYLFGAPWPKLLADYDLSGGRIWILVLMVTLFTPPVLRRRGARRDR